MIIAGFPFASSSTSGSNNSGSIGYLSGFDTTDKMLTINLGPNLSYAKLYRINDNAAPTDLPANAQSASGQINFTISYMT
jgi:hypothetical protein